MSNEEINKVRIAAFNKYGPVQVVRLRTHDGSVRYYLCKLKGYDILSIVAGGASEKEIMNQL